MISDVTRNKIDYSILALASAGYMTYFYINKTRTDLLFNATLVFTIFYVFWGVFHHLREKSLTIKIMLEYILVALLAIVIASTLLL